MQLQLPRLLQWPQHEPAVRDFAWRPGVTPLSSVPFVSAVVVGYPLAVLGLRWLLTSVLGVRKPLQLGVLPALHNFFLCVGSLAMFVGTLQAVLVESEETAWMWADEGRFSWLICLPKGTRPVGRMFFWSYMYYLSKFYELLDTLILVLKAKPLTFLHVYHHTIVVIMCYLWLEYQQSLQIIALLTNTGIHVLMYYYFMMHSLGMPPPWRRFVTNSQIIQFVFSGVMSVPFVVRHLSKPEGCAGFNAWLFNLAFNLTLLALFVNFHRRQYSQRRQASGKGGDAPRAKPE